MLVLHYEFELRGLKTGQNELGDGSNVQSANNAQERIQAPRSARPTSGRRRKVKVKDPPTSMRPQVAKGEYPAAATTPRRTRPQRQRQTPTTMTFQWTTKKQQHGAASISLANRTVCTLTQIGCKFDPREKLHLKDW